jgi:hypothetical protein
MEAVHSSQGNYFEENKMFASYLCLSSYRNNPRNIFFDDVLFNNGESTAEVI